MLRVASLCITLLLVGCAAPHVEQHPVVGPAPYQNGKPPEPAPPPSPVLKRDAWNGTIFLGNEAATVADDPHALNLGTAAVVNFTVHADALVPGSVMLRVDGSFVTDAPSPLTAAVPLAPGVHEVYVTQGKSGASVLRAYNAEAMWAES